MTRVAVLALFALLLLGSPVLGQSAEEIEKLIAQLGDEDLDVRRTAACALGQLESKAAPAVPALITALVDKDSHVRRDAAVALGLIGSAAAPAA